MPASRWVGHKMTAPPALPGGFKDAVVGKPYGVELPIRVWPADESHRNRGPCPWVLWLHGGSTCVGTPYQIPPWVVPEFTSRGFYVVSLGYRLSPHVALGDSIADCLTALDWCRNNLNGLFGHGSVDADRWVTGGESAGARLSTLLGLRATPPPKVVLDLYGHTTYFDDNVLPPLPPTKLNWPSHLPPIDKVIEEVECHDRSRALVHCPYFLTSESDLRETLSDPEFVLSERVFLQHAIVTYYALSKSKNYHALRLGECPDAAARKARIDQYSLLHLLDTVKTYPPTVIMQGLGDTIVIPSMSTDFAAKLDAKGVPHIALYEEGAPHGFDFVFTSPDIEDYDKFILPAMKFVEEHV